MPTRRSPSSSSSTSRARGRSRSPSPTSPPSSSPARTPPPAIAGRPGSSARRRKRCSRRRPPGPARLGAILVLAAVELEARALARALRLPRLKSFSFPAFGDARFRLAPVGLAASVLSARFPALLEGLEHPLVISAGVCGALDPAVSCGSLILPETVIGPRGERYAGAVAVDMESALILRAAAEAGCPGLVLRGVSDDAEDSLSPELAALVTAEGR